MEIQSLKAALSKAQHELAELKKRGVSPSASLTAEAAAAAPAGANPYLAGGGDDDSYVAATASAVLSEEAGGGAAAGGEDGAAAGAEDGSGGGGAAAAAGVASADDGGFDEDEGVAKISAILKAIFRGLVAARGGASKELGLAEFDLLGQVRKRRATQPIGQPRALALSAHAPPRARLTRLLHG